MSVEVLAPGLLTSVQDLGRHGQRAAGVGSAGAVDPFSLRVANLLVGNPASAAGLEITLSGPTLRLRKAARIALCGADIEASVDGHALPGWRPVDLPAGSSLQLGPCRRGCRSYLAIAGGIATPPVMGSRATDLRAGFGGLDGRALRAGDRLPVGGYAPPRTRDIRIAPWWINPVPDLDFDPNLPLRVLPGSDATAPPDALYALPWQVTAASDRQGCRINGRPLALAEPGERVSAPVAPGTIQLPPKGQPIVLMAEAQTIGGYPRIGHVITADLPRLAQRRPGELVVFAPTDETEALTALADQHHRLARMALAIAAKRNPG